MKMKIPFFLSLLGLFFFSWKFIGDEGNIVTKDSPSLEIRLREIGHQLLLKSGDSSSRVLPIEKLSPNEFKLQFENSLFIIPDTLVNIVKSSIQGSDTPDNYIVNVSKCATTEVVYGFEMYTNQKKNVIPCLGRSLPNGCYEISVIFKHPEFRSSQLAFFLLSLASCLIFGFVIFQKQNNGLQSAYLPLGKIRFYHEKQLLVIGKNTIELSSKENHLMKILASHPNEIISRNQLQKEVWEDDGVLVGRSLDVFISRLRKKLETESNIRIVNIHGKGYKLEV